MDSDFSENITLHFGIDMIRVHYDDMKFYYVENYYDYPLVGTCIHNGQIARFEANDETDYQLMNDTCPCCKDGGSDDYKDCHCEAYPDVHCELTPLGFIGTIKAIGRKYFWDWFHHPYLMWKFRKRINNRGNV